MVGGDPEKNGRDTGPEGYQIGDSPVEAGGATETGQGTEYLYSSLLETIKSAFELTGQTLHNFPIKEICNEAISYAESLSINDETAELHYFSKLVGPEKAPQIAKVVADLLNNPLVTDLSGPLDGIRSAITEHISQQSHEMVKRVLEKYFLGIFSHAVKLAKNLGLDTTEINDQTPEFAVRFITDLYTQSTMYSDWVAAEHVSLDADLFAKKMVEICASLLTASELPTNKTFLEWTEQSFQSYFVTLETEAAIKVKIHLMDFLYGDRKVDEITDSNYDFNYIFQATFEIQFFEYFFGKKLFDQKKLLAETVDSIRLPNSNFHYTGEQISNVAVLILSIKDRQNGIAIYETVRSEIATEVQRLTTKKKNLPKDEIQAIANVDRQLESLQEMQTMLDGMKDQAERSITEALLGLFSENEKQIALTLALLLQLKIIKIDQIGVNFSIENVLTILTNITNEDPEFFKHVRIAEIIANLAKDEPVDTGKNPVFLIEKWVLSARALLALVTKAESTTEEFISRKSERLFAVLHCTDSRQQKLRVWLQKSLLYENLEKQGSQQKNITSIEQYKRLLDNELQELEMEVYQDVFVLAKTMEKFKISLEELVTVVSTQTGDLTNGSGERRNIVINYIQECTGILTLAGLHPEFISARVMGRNNENLSDTHGKIYEEIDSWLHQKNGKVGLRRLIQAISSDKPSSEAPHTAYQVFKEISQFLFDALGIEVNVAVLTESQLKDLLSSIFGSSKKVNTLNPAQKSIYDLDSQQLEALEYEIGLYCARKRGEEAKSDKVKKTKLTVLGENLDIPVFLFSSFDKNDVWHIGLGKETMTDPQEEIERIIEWYISVHERETAWYLAQHYKLKPRSLSKPPYSLSEVIRARLQKLSQNQEEPTEEQVKAEVTKIREQIIQRPVKKLKESLALVKEQLSSENLATIESAFKQVNTAISTLGKAGGLIEYFKSVTNLLSVLAKEVKTTKDAKGVVVHRSTPVRNAAHLYKQILERFSETVLIFGAQSEKTFIQVLHAEYREFLVRHNENIKILIRKLSLDSSAENSIVTQLRGYIIDVPEELDSLEGITEAIKKLEWFARFVEYNLLEVFEDAKDQDQRWQKKAERVISSLPEIEPATTTGLSQESQLGTIIKRLKESKPKSVVFSLQGFLRSLHDLGMVDKAVREDEELQEKLAELLVFLGTQVPLEAGDKQSVARYLSGDVSQVSEDFDRLLMADQALAEQQSGLPPAEEPTDTLRSKLFNSFEAEQSTIINIPEKLTFQNMVAYAKNEIELNMDLSNGALGQAVVYLEQEITELETALVILQGQPLLDKAAITVLDRISQLESPKNYINLIIHTAQCPDKVMDKLRRKPDQVVTILDTVGQLGTNVEVFALRDPNLGAELLTLVVAASLK